MLIAIFYFVIGLILVTLVTTKNDYFREMVECADTEELFWIGAGVVFSSLVWPAVLLFSLVAAILKRLTRKKEDDE